MPNNETNKPEPSHIEDQNQRSLSWYIICLGTITVILSRLTNTEADPDLWGYLAFGRTFWTNPGFPYHDIFSYTPTKPLWVYHEWLTGVLFYPIYSKFGAFGLQSFKYSTGLLTACLIYLTARKRKALPAVALLSLLLISPVFSIGYSPVRAQIFTCLFFVLELLILETTVREEKKYYLLYWLIPIYILWGNLHGGFIAGLGIIFLYGLGIALTARNARPYFLILLIVTLVTLINPYGLHYWQYLIEALMMPRPEIDEWHSVFLAIGNGEHLINNAFYLLLIGLTIPLLITQRRQNVPALLVLVVTAVLGLMHLRHQTLFYLSLGVYMPSMASAQWELLASKPVLLNRWRRLGKAVTVPFFSILIIVFGYYFITGSPFRLHAPSWENHDSQDDHYYPVGAVQYMKTHQIKGRVLTEFSWGEYIIWMLYPECRVAMDGRYETVYPEDVCREFFTFSEGRTGWQNFLKKYPPDIIISQTNRPMTTVMLNHEGWRKIYTDPGCTLFMKQKE